MRAKKEKTILMSFRLPKNIATLINDGVEKCSLSGNGFGLNNNSSWSKTEFIVNALVEWQNRNNSDNI